jgi:hypothetical protein
MGTPPLCSPHSPLPPEPNRPNNGNWECPTGESAAAYSVPPPCAGKLGRAGHLGQVSPGRRNGPRRRQSRAIESVQPEAWRKSIDRFLFPEIDFNLNPCKSVQTSKIHRKLSRTPQNINQSSFGSFLIDVHSGLVKYVSLLLISFLELK